MSNSERRGSRYWPLAWAMVLSLWVHILGFALLRYAPPAAASPSPLPLIMEFEEPPAVITPPEAAGPPTERDRTGAKDGKSEPKATSLPEIRPAGPFTLDSIPPDEEIISLESKAPEYVSFLGRVKALITNRWIFPPEARKKRQGGRLTAVFTLSRTGDVVRLIVEESSGRPVLDDAALEAIRGAAPFPGFPEHIALPHLNIRAHFDYRIKYVTVK
ncbi:MAG: TonB family protein [Pseudomonadota bacterium]